MSSPHTDELGLYILCFTYLSKEDTKFGAVWSETTSNSPLVWT